MIYLTYETLRLKSNDLYAFHTGMAMLQEQGEYLQIHIHKFGHQMVIRRKKMFHKFPFDRALNLLNAFEQIFYLNNDPNPGSYLSLL